MKLTVDGGTKLRSSDISCLSDSSGASFFHGSTSSELRASEDGDEDDGNGDEHADRGGSVGRRSLRLLKVSTVELRC